MKCTGIFFPMIMEMKMNGHKYYFHSKSFFTMVQVNYIGVVKITKYIKSWCKTLLGLIFETTIRLTLARKRQDWIYCCAQNVTVLTVKVNKSMLIREQQSRQIRWIGRPRREDGATSMVPQRWQHVQYRGERVRLSSAPEGICIFECRPSIRIQMKHCTSII